VTQFDLKINWEKYHKEAGELYEAGEYEGARELLETANRNYPDNSDIEWSLGFVYSLVGEEEKGRELMQRAVNRAFGGNGPKVYTNLVELLDDFNKK